MVRLTIDDKYESVPWDEIDAVVFDVGNVLLEFSPTALIREKVPEREDLHERLLNKIMRSPYWLMLDHGTATQEEAIVAMTGREKELEPYIRRVMGERLELTKVLEEGLGALRACKAHGKKTYVLSNFHDGAFDYVVGRHEFFGLFDGEVVSARVGLLKPDPAIFRYLTDKFQLEPSRTLFIDDTPANIEGALHAGWQGLCYNEKGRIAKFFAPSDQG